MNDVKKNWTGNIQSGEQANQDMILKQLCHAFNTSPFFKFNHMQMRPVDGHIEAYVEMQPELVGNVAFQILHGGVAATLLDSLGGVVTMAKLYSQAKDDDLAETAKKAARVATVDMRVDYLAPGRGKHFIATAEVLRMGRKGCTMRMNMVNDEGKPIATGIASYAY